MRAIFGLLVRCFAAVQVPVVLRRPVQFIVMSVTAVTLPIFRGVLCDGSLPGSAIYRHREKVFSIRFSEWCDDRDTRDSSLWAFSLEGGAHLYFVDPYPFKLTRQTQRRS